MDLQRTKILLDKINRLHQNILDSNTSISGIEKKLMLDYLSNMYDAVLDENPIKKSNPVIIPKPITKKEEPKPVAQKAPVVVKEKVVQPTPPKPEPEIVFTKEPDKVAPEAKKPAPTPAKIEKEPDLVFEKPVEKPKKKNGFNSQYDEMFSFDESGELSDKLAKSPIANIKKAMGINERYLTINELFDGKAKKFEETVNQLDGMDNFDQARSYLEENSIKNYGWDDPSKIKKAKRFLKLVRSRYL